VTGSDGGGGRLIKVGGFAVMMAEVIAVVQVRESDGGGWLRSVYAVMHCVVMETAQLG
jgi:hypothetical protein